MRRRLQKSPMQKAARAQQERGRRKPPKPKAEFNFTPKDGYRIIATVFEDIFEDGVSPKIKNQVTRRTHVSFLILDKGVYEIILHPNRYTVILKDAMTGEIVSLPTPLTRLEFERQVNCAKIRCSEEPVKSKKKKSPMSSQTIMGPPIVIEDESEEEEVLKEIEGVEEVPEPEELKGEAEEDKASEE